MTRPPAEVMPCQYHVRPDGSIYIVFGNATAGPHCQADCDLPESYVKLLVDAYNRRAAQPVAGIDGIGHPADTILYEDSDGNTHCVRPEPAREGYGSAQGEMVSSDMPTLQSALGMARPAQDEAAVERVARAICKSGKFECGQGCCAPICMEALGDARTKCGHVVRVHGKLARSALAAAREVG